MGKSKKIVVESLDRSPSHLLHRALQLALDIYSAETEGVSVTQRQFAVLAAVAEHAGLTQTDLVRATGIDRSTLADMIARMIAKDYLVREKSQTDARANTVHLSDTGRTILEEATPRVRRADARILGLLSSGKRDGLISVLRDLSKAGEKVLVSDIDAADGADKPAKAKGPKPEKKKKKKKDKEKAKAAE
jgi:DNA-binding MarR family transcriptional regulator